MDKPAPGSLPSWGPRRSGRPGAVGAEVCSVTPVDSRQGCSQRLLFAPLEEVNGPCGQKKKVQCWSCSQ